MRLRDSRGNYFNYEEIEIDWREKNKIISEINTNYSKYEKTLYGVHISHDLEGRAYRYYFENHGFDDINIYLKRLVRR